MEWTHEGTSIAVNANGEFDAGGRRFLSLAEAKAGITESNKAARHAVDKAVNLVVLTRQGFPVTLHRIHEGTGAWLTEPKGAEGPFYINNPEVAGLLQQMDELKTAENKLARIVAKAEIKYRKGYGHQTAEGVEATTLAFLHGVETAKTVWAASLQAR